MAKGDSYGSPKTIPERRGFSPIPKDRTKKYSVLSYRALFGIPEELAERFHGHANSHADVVRHIQRHYSEHSEMKLAALTEYDGPGAVDPTREEAEELMERMSRVPWSDVGKDLT